MLHYTRGDFLAAFALALESKMRILLVEDDPMIGDAIQRALSDASYAADWVKNGITGLAALDTLSLIHI